MGEPIEKGKVQIMECPFDLRLSRTPVNDDRTNFGRMLAVAGGLAVAVEKTTKVDRKRRTATAIKHGERPGNKAMDEWQSLRAAFNRVKEFPEFNPNERVLWLELRIAVEKILEKGEPR